MTDYAELAAASNFSFLRGASHPDELVIAAKALGLQGLGLADRNSLAGVVRAHKAAKEAGLRFFPGARLVLQCGFEVIAYPETREAYGRLARLLTRGNRRAPKGECFLYLEDLCELGAGQVLIAMPGAKADRDFSRTLRILGETFPGSVYLGAAALYRGDEARRLTALARLSREARAPLLATNDVEAHSPERRPLQDVLTAIREHTTVAAAGWRLQKNAERHLKSGAEIARLFVRYPEAVARSLEVAQRLSFSLDELAYEYPDEVLGDGESAQDRLCRLTWEGAAKRYPGGVPERVRAGLEHELALVGELRYAPYFLTVYDIVRFARSRDILCQGRGSAANSSVCYCLGITAVDPARIDLLFERFVSAERNEPPDIDVDFEHERREEVIQYIYEKYGRARAGIAATVISYRARSAVREVGKAMGLSLDVVGALAGTVWGWSTGALEDTHIAELGLDPADPTIAQAMVLTRELIGFPRHLSQHVGGFVITRGALEEVVPIQNAAMEERTFVEWDKDDLDALGILKIDVLALGMLTCIAKSFSLLAEHYARPLGLADVPPEDPRVYDMLCRADSIGVFQVESRAQMTMLPRLKPRSFYDLVIEVAIVRPGPIQGDMVHPYLRRREGREEVRFPSQALEDVLGKTLGVPLFQEQAMRIAIVAAGFTPAEADRLRRAMATFRKAGIIHEFGVRLVEGMVKNGYERDFAERCFKQIEGFGEYGFPESHAASFALLVYISAWIKCHYPDVFLAAILNSQPMGFYAPAQLVRDAREHGVTAHPVCVNRSGWDSRLEALAADEKARPTGEGGAAFAVRLGFRQIKGLKEEDAHALVAARPAGGFSSVRDLWARVRMSRTGLEKLADADAFAGLGLTRRAALWEIRALGADPLPLFAALGAEGEAGPAGSEAPPALPALTRAEAVVEDYRSMRLSLKDHPMRFLRPRLQARGFVRAGDLKTVSKDRRLLVAGLVLVRQRPGSASGVIFATLEDETGVANIVVWPDIFKAHRRIVMGARLMGVRGRLQREGLVIHVVADTLWDMSPALGALSAGHEAMGEALAHADEVKRPGEEPRSKAGFESMMKIRRSLRASSAARRMLPKSRDFH